MRYALIDTHRVEATPAGAATCPSCDARVRAKCGPIVAWHWAHIAADCDEWAEPDSDWHRTWQQSAPADRREVVIGAHRADVIAADGTVVELQHSSISADDIADRERHYGEQMIWIFDAQDAFYEKRIIIRPRAAYVTFRWKHPRKSIALCRRPVVLDLGNDRVLRIKKIHTAAPCGGWGNLGRATALQAWIKGSPLESVA